MAPEKENSPVEKVQTATKKVASEKSKNPQKNPRKDWLILLIIGITALLIGIGCIIFALLKPKAESEALNYPTIPSKTAENNTYSDLTGLPLSNASLKSSPIYCMQVPNGTDGARPQAGLDEAGVIFEAIAEAGITRFAAIFQNPSSAVTGPIRSLRLYYLEWDTPFDCTIVHAGGADDALSAVSSGGYSDLSEDYNYMYRGTYGTRLWNNLFTNPTNLAKFSNDSGKTSSNAQGFTRMTPEESNKSRIDSLVAEKLNITTSTNKNTSELTPKVTNIDLNFGSSDIFNVNYEYDASSNTYRRNYGIGPHQIYTCPDENLGERNPEDVCELTTMSPSTIVAMIVSERRASDNYHEGITTIGSGDAYIFQNGTAVEGKWSKPSRNDQIKFTDSEGNEIKLAPGQTFVSAIPNYGSVEY